MAVALAMNVAVEAAIVRMMVTMVAMATMAVAMALTGAVS